MISTEKNNYNLQNTTLELLIGIECVEHSDYGISHHIDKPTVTSLHINRGHRH